MPSLRAPVLTAALATAVAAALVLPGSGNDLDPVASATASQFRGSLGDVAFRDSLPPFSVTTYVHQPGSPVVSSWRTTAGSRGLVEQVAPQADLPVRPVVGGEELVVGEPVAGTSPVVGFGGALTASSAYLIDTATDRETLLDELFAADQASFDVVRVPMGATDMETASVHTSYADTPDPTLAGFSVARDEAHVLPVLRDALERNPDLTVVAAPWSAPGWMKIGRTYRGNCFANENHLRPDMVGTYAQYYVRFLEEYAERGVDVAQVSLGNEPQHCDSSYPTMNMTAREQANLALALRPALDAAGFADVEILGWDHNYVDEGTLSPTRYPDDLLRAAGDAVDAIGYHCYQTRLDSDPAATQTTLRPAWMTECTGSQRWRDTRENLVNETHLALLNPLRHGAVASVYWNLALDSSGGPHLGGCSSCRGMVTVDGGTHRVGESTTYWEQVSRFVQPGAVLLSSTQRRPTETVAYRNPDGSRVLVVLNSSRSTLDWGTPAETGTGTDAPTSTATGPAATVPTLPAPTVTVPTLPAPTITVPTLPAPTITVPTLPAPTVTVPTLPAPTLTLPPAPSPPGLVGGLLQRVVSIARGILGW